MPSAYESAIANQAIYKIAEVTAPENPAAALEGGMNSISYTPKDRMYEGRTSIADAVKEAARGKDPVVPYSSKPIRENNPEKSLYAALMNYSMN